MNINVAIWETQYIGNLNHNQLFYVFGYQFYLLQEIFALMVQIFGIKNNLHLEHQKMR